jgi:hypothetical protein
MIAGVIACLLTINAPIYQGPVSRLLDGADLTWILGFVVGGVTYWVLTRFANTGQAPGSPVLATAAER